MCRGFLSTCTCPLGGGVTEETQPQLQLRCDSGWLLLLIRLRRAPQFLAWPPVVVIMAGGSRPARPAVAPFTAPR